MYEKIHRIGIHVYEHGGDTIMFIIFEELFFKVSFQKISLQCQFHVQQLCFGKVFFTCMYIYTYMCVYL